MLKNTLTKLKEKSPYLILSALALIPIATGIKKISEWNDQIYYGKVQDNEYVIVAPRTTLTNEETSPCTIIAHRPHNVTLEFRCDPTCLSLLKNKFYRSCTVDVFKNKKHTKTLRNFGHYDNIIEKTLEDALEK